MKEKSKKESFYSLQPSDPLIKEHIAYYYFHTKMCGKAKSIVYYPNINTALTFYKHSNISFHPKGAIIKPDKSVNFFPCYTHIWDAPRVSEMNTPFTKLGVVFNPLSFNHFIPMELSKLFTPSDNLEFNHFQKSIEKTLTSVFETQDDKQKVDLLDTYFLSQYSLMKDSFFRDYIQHAIETKQKSVTILSQDLGVHRRTLLRLFKKHLCISPKKYLSIMLFRMAMKEYLATNNNKSLTSISYSNNYYDQAALINHFKKLTKVNPLEFLKNLDEYGSSKLYWSSTD